MLVTKNIKKITVRKREIRYC